MKKTLLVFPPEEVIREDWQICFLSSGFNLKPYDESFITESIGVLIFTPFKTTDREWVTPEFVWKNYFSVINPKFKIIQIGYRNNINLPNYLHWGKPIESFANFYQKCQPVEIWNIQDTYGKDLRMVWTMFRDGHDKGGFMDWFIGAKWEVSTVLSKMYNLNEGPKSAAAYLKNNPDADQAFENMKLRWVRYFSYFLATPFAKMISDLDSQVSVSYDSWIDIKKQKEIEVHLNKLESCFKGIDSLLLTIEPWFKYG